MGRRITRLDGQTFGFLTVICVSDKRTKSGNVLHKCLCRCGAEALVSTASLRRGSTISCGCHRKARLTKHGMSGTKLYKVWEKMIYRCYNPASKDFKWYGGKGVTVCDSWKRDFLAFSEWAMANGYRDGLTIDRIVGEKGYEPGNCRFITIQRQQRNKSSNRLVIYQGVEMCLADAISLVRGNLPDGVTEKTIRSRVSGYGWSFEKAITTELNSTKGFASRKAFVPLWSAADEARMDVIGQNGNSEHYGLTKTERQA